MYIKIINGIPTEYSADALRYDNPNISFPLNISNSILEKFNVYPFTIQEKPIINEKTEKIEPNGFIQDENGNWVKSWKITLKTLEEIDLWIAEKK